MKKISRISLGLLLIINLFLLGCYGSPKIETTNYLIPNLLPSNYTTYNAGDTYQISYPDNWTIMSSVEVKDIDQEIERNPDLAYMEEKIIFIAGDYGKLYGQEYYDPAVAITTGPKPAFWNLEDMVKSVKLGLEDQILNLQIISTTKGNLSGQEVVILNFIGKPGLGYPYYRYKEIITIADKAFWTVTYGEEAIEDSSQDIAGLTVVKSFKLLSVKE